MTEPSRIRIGTVPYLNVEPLVWALDGAAPGVELVAATPRKLAGLLADGAVDAGLVPVAEVIRTGEWPVVPGVSIACEGRVRSVVLLSKTPLRQIRSVLLDRSSMTSILLGQVILRDVYGVAPAATLSDQPLRADHDFTSDPHDAFILIGNEALRSESVAFPHRLDLGEAWKAFTGLPFVFAVWAVGERGKDKVESVARVLTEAAVRGLHNLEAVCEAGAQRHDLPIDLVCRYLTESIRYGLGPHEQRAITEFGRRLVAGRLLEEAHPLVFAQPAAEGAARKTAEDR